MSRAASTRKPMPADAHFGPPTRRGTNTTADCDEVLARMAAMRPETAAAVMRWRAIADAWLDERLDAAAHERFRP